MAKIKGNVSLMLLFVLFGILTGCEPMKIIKSPFNEGKNEVINFNVPHNNHNYDVVVYEEPPTTRKSPPTPVSTTTKVPTEPTGTASEMSTTTVWTTSEIPHTPTTQPPPDPPNPIKDIVNTLRNINNTLNIIKENSIAMAKAVKNVCPNRYERLVKGCFYVRESSSSSRAVSWVSARLYCQAIDGDLAVVDDIPKFVNYYENQPNTRFQEYHWYGASRIGHEILYVNGTVLPASSSLWEAGYPGPGNCVALHTSKQKLITTDCTKPYYFICKSEE